METQTIINIIAIIFSPIIAVVIGEILRKRNFEKQKRLEIIHDLMAYRDKVNSPEFLRALNSLKLFFKDKKLRELLDKLYSSFKERDKGKGIPGESESLITTIIKKVCELEKFKHLSNDDIDNLFSRK